MGVLAMKYSRTFVSYDTEKHSTCLWIYENKSRMVIYFHQEGYYCPPLGSIFIVYNGVDHFEYLALNSENLGTQDTNCEIRILRVGDEIEYRTGETYDDIQPVTKVKEIAPDDDIRSIVFEDGFYLSCNKSTHKVRKIETPTQAGTSWGYIGNYLLCCESRRTRKRLQRQIKSVTCVEVISDEDEAATIKDKSREFERGVDFTRSKHEEK